MSKQIIINTDSQKTSIAIVEDGDLAELFIETEEHERTLGNLFLGKVRRIMPSIQAAFVDIGQKQDAFLHFSDLSDNLADWLAYLGEQTPEIGRFKPQHLAAHKGRKRRRPLHGRRHDTDAADDPEEEDEDEFELEDEGDGEDEEGGDGQHHAVKDARSRGRRRSMQRRLSPRTRDDGPDEPVDAEPEGPPVHTLLQRDQSILVKISKEPIAQKGSRITTDISLAGRFLVLVPMANYVAVSKKIASFKERRRLRALAKSLLPDGFGVIVRTVAQNQTAKTLDTDLRLLVERWQKIEAKLAGRPKPPMVVHEDVNMVSSVIRDLFSDNYDRILVDNQRLYRNVKSYVQAVAPDMGVTVQLHQSNEPIFRAAGIERKVAEAFEKRINLPSGAYLFLEQTEAMHVIDVNSGRAGRGMSQEDSSLKVNLEAARAIAKQIRLRDLGGIVVVDFIDLRSERSRRKVLEELKKEFRRDRAVTKVLPMSDFGLIQITRQRLRPSITTTFSDLHSSPQAESGSALSASESVSRMMLPAVHMAESLTPEAMLLQFEDWIKSYRRAGHRAPVRLAVHPFVAAYLNRRLPSQSTRWFLRFGQRVRIESDMEQDVSTWCWLDLASGEDVTRIPEAPKKEKAVKAPAEDRHDDSDDGGRGQRDGEGRRDGDDRRDRGGRGRGRGRRGDRQEGRGRDDRSGRSEERGGDRRDSRGRGDQRPDDSGGRGGQRQDERGSGRGDRRDDRGGDRSRYRRDDRGGDRPGDRRDDRGGDRPGDRRDDRGGDRPRDRRDDRSGDRTSERPDEKGESRAAEAHDDRRDERHAGRSDDRGRGPAEIAAEAAAAAPAIDRHGDDADQGGAPPTKSGASRRGRGRGRSSRPMDGPEADGASVTDVAGEPAPAEDAPSDGESKGGARAPAGESRRGSRGGSRRGARKPAADASHDDPSGDASEPSRAEASTESSGDGPDGPKPRRRGGRGRGGRGRSADTHETGSDSGSDAPGSPSAGEKGDA